jgi:hypothetical protein
MEHLTEVVWEDIFGNEVKRDFYDLRSQAEKKSQKDT